MAADVVPPPRRASDRRDYQADLDAIAAAVRQELTKGKVATYIPALARVPRSKFGIAICSVDGRTAQAGDANEPFSIQSVSKVFTLQMALRLVGLALWHRVGREPSGNRFNSLVQLEYEQGIPRNPFINAGAHVVTDCIVTEEADPKKAILAEFRRLSGNREVAFDREVARSKREHGHWNAAIANFLKAHGNLRANVDKVLDAYFHQSSIAMSCRELARARSFLANGGVDVGSGARITTAQRAKRINAVMMTCGLYDAVGNFAFRVGIPATSGVGGGILGIIPGVLSVAVWSLGLDPSGNSHAGVKALELFTERIGKSVF
ncbi:MAG: glutaminase [Rhodospirillaceae bacterium]